MLLSGSSSDLPRPPCLSKRPRGNEAGENVEGKATTAMETPGTERLQTDDFVNGSGGVFDQVRIKVTARNSLKGNFASATTA